MRASLQLARAGLNVAVLTKVFPTRSHTVAAQGRHRRVAGQHVGRQLALPLLRHDQGQRLARRPGRDRVHVPRGAEGRLSSSTWGCRSTATPTARSTSARSAATPPTTAKSPCSAPAPRPTGPATRCCTLYQQNLKAHALFVEWMALDLIRDADGDVLGVTALEMETGEVHILEAKTTLLATGGPGASTPPAPTPSSTPATASGMAARAGTAAGRHGVLAVPPDRRRREPACCSPRAAAARGAILRNCDGERFMERRADAERTWRRATSSTAAWTRRSRKAAAAGRTGLRRARHDAPGRRDDHEAAAVIFEIGHNFANVDITKGADPRGADDPLPDGRHPDQHPRSRSRSLRAANTTPWSTGCTRWASAPASACTRQPPGHQFAARPRRVRPRGGQPHRRVQQGEPGAQALAGRRRRRVAGAPGALDASTSGEYAQDVADAIRSTMQSHAAVFRTQATMDEGVRRIAEVAARQVDHAEGQVKVFNTARIEALEVENLVEVARATMVSAAARHECRGAHTVRTTNGRPTTRSSRSNATTPSG